MLLTGDVMLTTNTILIDGTSNQKLAKVYCLRGRVALTFYFSIHSAHSQGDVRREHGPLCRCMEATFRCTRHLTAFPAQWKNALQSADVTCYFLQPIEMQPCSPISSPIAVYFLLKQTLLFGALEVLCTKIL